MSYLRLSSIAFMCILCASLCLGQQSASMMTNADVVELVSMGLSDGIVLDKINSAGAAGFDTSIPGLKALKASKVSDTVIRAMMTFHSGASAGVLPGAANDANSAGRDDPASPHDPGIYMYVKERGAAKLVLLEPTFYSQGKTGGMFASAMTYGIAKMKQKAVVPGAHASLKSNDSATIFYFYFEQSANAKDHETFGGSVTPGEYTLLKFDEKKTSRETVTMQGNAFGMSHGTDEKATTGFTSTKLRTGIYKVVPNGPLVSGEYCFLSSTTQAGAGAAQRLYDFSIVTE